MKIFSIIGLTILTIFAFFLGQIPLIEGRRIIDPYIDTEFAENYSPEEFEKIKVSMSIDEVTRMIGAPLYVGPAVADTFNTVYTYTSDGKLLNESQQEGGSGYDDFAWYRSSLVVDSLGKVISIEKGWSRD